MALCASSHERGPLRLRKVKKSAKMRRWVITPLRMATSMNMVQKPMIQRAQIADM
ncbi:hypothetical protein D3C85_1827700 [compost metagenome]